MSRGLASGARTQFAPESTVLERVKQGVGFAQARAMHHPKLVNGCQALSKSILQLDGREWNWHLLDDAHVQPLHDRALGLLAQISASFRVLQKIGMQELRYASRSIKGDAA